LVVLPVTDKSFLVTGSTTDDFPVCAVILFIYLLYLFIFGLTTRGTPTIPAYIY
jgi:hypothetical protein